MPKKNFKKVADDNPALLFLGKNKSDDVHAVHDVRDVDSVGDVHDVDNVHAVHDVHAVDNVHDKDDVQTKDDVHDIGDVHDVHAEHDVHHVGDVQYVHSKQPVHIQDKPVKYCNINLRLRQDLKDYLSDESWRVRKNVTQYLNDIIEAEMMAKKARDSENDI